MGWIVGTVSAVGAVIVAVAAVIAWQMLDARVTHGTFRCKIRVSDGTLRGFSPRWPKRITRAGWARDVLIVFPRPALFRLRTLPVACAQGDIHTLARGEVTRLGRRPVALDLVLDDGPRLEVAASAKARDRLCGPYLVPRAMPNRPNPPSGQQGVQR
jgi:hypothetical protein